MSRVFIEEISDKYFGIKHRPKNLKIFKEKNSENAWGRDVTPISMTKEDV